LDFGLGKKIGDCASREQINPSFNPKSKIEQPIQYNSRKRSLQRFLNLPKLNVRLLWFPLLKYWIRQVETRRALNRDQRRRLKKLKHHKYGHWIITIDRTQWKGRNVFMVSLVWGTKEFWILDFRLGDKNRRLW